MGLSSDSNAFYDNLGHTCKYSAKLEGGSDGLLLTVIDLT